MNRREFFGCSAAAAAATFLPAFPETWEYSWNRYWWKSSRGRVVTEEQLVEGFAYQGYKRPDLVVVDEATHKLLNELWSECV